MCKHSLESYTQRKAIEGETLVVASSLHGSGMFAPKDGSKQLACVISGTILTIEDFQPTHVDGYGKDYTGRLIHRSVTSYNGKRVVAKFIDGRHASASQIGTDCIMFDDIFFPVMWLARNVEAYVGVKATLSDKLKLDEKSLRSVSADIEREEPVVEHQMPEHRLTGRRRTFDRADGDD